jgi:arylsulfatase A-like enzyme
MGKFGNSPMFDAYLADLARAAMAEMKLGKGPGTDLLGVSFSMTDVVGHEFGPRSHEVQDVLARLDASIGALFQALDQLVGKDEYVVALSADHGVAIIPEQAKAEGKDAGRISATELRKRATDAITTELGPASAGPYVVELQGNDLYLAPGVHDRLAAKAGALARIVEAVRVSPGIERAFDSADLRDPATAKDPVQRAAALSYFHGRSGDILVLPKENWIFGSIGTSHGSTHDYDQRVPVVFYGKGIKPGKYQRVVSPADIVPTLARLVGVKATKAEGSQIPEITAPARP